MTVYGVHAGLQNVPMGDLRALWRHIESLGFDWISIWDHFYAATFDPKDPYCHEAVATHAALACDTTRVRCGSLVYCAGYRHPAVLAKAIATIDQLSGGRTDVGIGAGWAQVEYDAYGIPFGTIGSRMDLLEESIQVLRMLLRDDVSNFEGKHFSLVDARCDPKPVQRAIPIWVGGGGEKRTLRIAAKYADGWNIPFVDPTTFAHKRDVLHEHCADVGRDAASIRTTVNVGLAWSEESIQEQFGQMTERVRPGVLTGSVAQILERIAEYEAAGADQINLAIRAPFTTTHGDLEKFAAALGLG